MKVGDVVIPIGDTVLACGGGRYTCAIVANIEPFVLASVEADMLWTCTIKPEDVQPLCKAARHIVKRAVIRYAAHVQKKREVSMSTTRATARVQITIEVAVTDVWADDCPIGQVYRQAADSGIQLVRNMVERAPNCTATIISDPNVIGILTNVG